MPLPGVADIDTIAAKFFIAKGKSCTLQFQPGKGIEVFLELENKKYLEIVSQLEHTDKVEPFICSHVLWYISSSTNYLLLWNPFVIDLPHARPPVLSQPDNDDDYDGT